MQGAGNRFNDLGATRHPVRTSGTVQRGTRESAATALPTRSRARSTRSSSDSTPTRPGSRTRSRRPSRPTRRSTASWAPGRSSPSRVSTPRTDAGKDLNGNCRLRHHAGDHRRHFGGDDRLHHRPAAVPAGLPADPAPVPVRHEPERRWRRSPDPHRTGLRRQVQRRPGGGAGHGGHPLTSIQSTLR